MFTKKDRRIANLEAMVKNRDILIETLTEVINSLEEDLKAVKEEAYKTAKKPTTRKKAK